jgi:hypothetical protein
MNIFTSGGLPIGTGVLNLTVGNTEELVSSGTSIIMTTYGGRNGNGDFIQSTMKLSLQGFTEPTREIKSAETFTLFAVGGIGDTFDTLVGSDMNLYMLGAASPSSILPLYITNFNTEQEQTGSMSLNIANSRLAFGRPSFLWDGHNFGSAIDVDDNINGTLFAKADIDEIRGVDITASGIVLLLDVKNCL